MIDTQLLTQRWLQPNWPHIPGVHALFTTREGGVSQAPWDSMNLGNHVHDDPAHVVTNRAVLERTLAKISGTAVQAIFLQQVHGCNVQNLQHSSLAEQAFDACLTDKQRLACTIMVADCLPVLIAHRSGQVVGAAHAGWRGLLGQQGHGVLEALWQAYAAKLGVRAGDTLAQDTQVWLGPCIGPQAFEVGDEVRTAFIEDIRQADACFLPAGQDGKWLANLPQLARLHLRNLGVEHIYGNDGSMQWCTVSNPSLFFSHRRDAAALGSTGRMAACIWKG